MALLAASVALLTAGLTGMHQEKMAKKQQKSAMAAAEEERRRIADKASRAHNKRQRRRKRMRRGLYNTGGFGANAFQEERQSALGGQYTGY